MAVKKSEGVKYENAVTFHVNNCYNSCLEKGYFTKFQIPDNATDAQKDGYSQWNDSVEKRFK